MQSTYGRGVEKLLGPRQREINYTALVTHRCRLSLRVIMEKPNFCGISSWVKFLISTVHENKKAFMLSSKNADRSLFDTCPIQLILARVRLSKVKGELSGGHFDGVMKLSFLWTTF